MGRRQGATDIDFFCIPEDYGTPGPRRTYGLTVYILGVLLPIGVHIKIVLKEMLFLQEHVPSTMHVPEENSAWLTS